MLKLRLIEFFVFVCLLGAVMPANAAGPPDAANVLEYLDQTFPDQYHIVAKISATHLNRIVFPKNDRPINKGREVLVLRHQRDIPAYLLPVAGVWKIDHQTADTHIATQLAAFEDKRPSVGDAVAIPAAPVIYLYSNLARQTGGDPYQALLQGLLKNRYEVVEVDHPEDATPNPPYGILMGLEGPPNTPVIKVKSLYSGATLYSSSHAVEFETQASQAGERKALPPIKPSDTPRPSQKSPGMAQKTDAFEKAPKKSDFQEVEAQKVRAFQRIGLAEAFERLVICQLDHSEEMEFVLLNNEKIAAFHIVSGELQAFSTYRFKPENLIGIHLHAMDLTGNGRDELLVTTGYKKMVLDAWTTRLASRILSFQKNRLLPLASDIPFYLRAISDKNGRSLMLGQKNSEAAAYAGDILKLRLSTDGGIRTSVYEPAKGVYSVYQFNFIPGFANRLMILEPSHRISVYETTNEKRLDITDLDYGAFEIIPYPLRLEELEFRGGFDKIATKNAFAPRRFVLKPNYDDQVFTINKQRKTKWDLKKLKNIISDQQVRDNLTAFKWTGQQIHQTWESKKYAKDILDFAFMPGPAGDEIFLLVNDAQGFALQRIE